MIASLLIVSALLASSTNGGEAVAAPRVQPFAHGWISTEAPMQAQHTLLVVADSIVVTSSGDELEVGFGWPLELGDTLVDGAAVHVGERPTLMMSAFAPEELIELPTLVTLFVQQAPGPSAPSWPSYSCSVVCTGYACCRPGTPYPFCGCLTPQQWQQQQSTCTGGGVTSQGCTISQPYIPPSWNPPAPSPPAAPPPGGVPQH